MATERKQVYKCGVCGIVAEVLDGGAGEMSCCGQPMKLLTENTVDASKEKHVPVIAWGDGGCTVTVGGVEHPMEPKHFIQMIELEADGVLHRRFLSPGERPVATFDVKQTSRVVARELCNLHGLWKS